MCRRFFSNWSRSSFDPRALGIVRPLHFTHAADLSNILFPSFRTLQDGQGHPLRLGGDDHDLRLRGASPTNRRWSRNTAAQQALVRAASKGWWHKHYTRDKLAPSIIPRLHRHGTNMRTPTWKCCRNPHSLRAASCPQDTPSSSCNTFLPCLVCLIRKSYHMRLQTC